jgi:hypothetical protein
MGAACVSLVCFGGYLVGLGYALPGALFIGPGASCLGLIVANLQTGMWSRRRFDGGLNLQTLWDVLSKEDSFTAETPVYVANPDLAPAGGLYIARIDGQRALVIEKGEPRL